MLNRRQFLVTTGTAALAATLPSCRTAPKQFSGPAGVKPIRGSWISIWWDDKRHEYWNETCRNYTAEQWRLAIKDVADAGLQYLVLLAVAKGGKAFYDTPLLPKLDMACPIRSGKCSRPPTATRSNSSLAAIGMAIGTSAPCMTRTSSPSDFR